MLYLGEEDYGKILKYCKDSLPDEACGLIAGIVEGNKRIVKKVYFLTNIDQSNEHFSMDTKEQFAAIRDMRTNNLQLLGNFHSHPESLPIPSEEDKRLAYDSKVNYLIISLMDIGNPVFDAFWIDEDKNVIKEETIIG